MNFERMSRGWAHGTREFKKALLKDSEKEQAMIARGGSSGAEAKELRWESLLELGLAALGKNRDDAARDRKFADWKVALCAWLRGRALCRNRWLSEQLSMGTDAALSRYMKRLRDGELEGAAKLARSLERALQATGKAPPTGAPR